MSGPSEEQFDELVEALGGLGSIADSLNSLFRMPAGQESNVILGLVQTIEDTNAIIRKHGVRFAEAIDRHADAQVRAAEIQAAAIDRLAKAISKGATA